MNNDSLSKIEVIKSILDDVEEDISNEDLIHRLLEKQLTKNTVRKEEKITFGQKASDAIAHFVGSWKFIISFIAILFLWILTNVFFLVNAFDPYPFILLNLALSCVAAIQAPLIMMSQNRQEEKDRARAQNDYLVNLKSEIIIQDIHQKLDEILNNQERYTAIIKHEESEKKNHKD
ncbi:MAG: DUF1003 domain-containing protein [Anaerofustis sp.]